MPRDQDYSAVDELRRVAKAHGIDDLTEFRLAEILNQKDHLAHLRNEFFYPKMRSLPHGEPFFQLFGKIKCVMNE